MPIMKFNTDEEVVKLANDSRYGLGCAVFSGSQHRARELASQIQCGVAAINDFASNYMCQVFKCIFDEFDSVHVIPNDPTTENASSFFSPCHLVVSRIVVLDDLPV